jgi:hypothetical protein
MATPIDFDGDTYGEPISDMDFRSRFPMTPWGWRRAMRKMTAEKILADSVRKEKDMTGESFKGSYSSMKPRAIELGRKAQDLENAMLWDEYKAARKEWLEFLKGTDVDLRIRLVKCYWLERDRGLTGE